MAKDVKPPKPGKNYDLLKSNMSLKNMIMLFENSKDSEAVSIAKAYFKDNFDDFNENDIVYILRNSKFIPNSVINSIPLEGLQINQARVINKYSKNVKPSVLTKVRSKLVSNDFKIDEFY